jgi:hypothetical protein
MQKFRDRGEMAEDPSGEADCPRELISIAKHHREVRVMKFNEVRGKNASF